MNGIFEIFNNSIWQHITFHFASGFIRLVFYLILRLKKYQFMIDNYIFIENIIYSIISYENLKEFYAGKDNNLNKYFEYEKRAILHHMIFFIISLLTMSNWMQRGFMIFIYLQYMMVKNESFSSDIKDIISSEFLFLAIPIILYYYENLSKMNFYRF
jgi:hypothetical protein